MSREFLQNIIEDFNLEKFVRFFRDKNRTFAPKKEDLLQYNDDNFRNGIKLGETQFAQDEKMHICAFEASQPLSERSGKKAQYEKGKRILKETNADAGIFIFYDGNGNFRFSLIYPEYSGTSRQWSYFKRFTYFVSPALTNKTFLEQIGKGDFSSFKKIKEAFSVEPVTKQFYGELQYWYFWAMDKIKFPDDYKYSNDLAKDKEIRNATNLIRLITRIIFIWFLTEKGLIPPELFSREKLGRIIKDFIKDKKASNFYNAILQNLFFGTLNQKMDERKFVQEGGFYANIKEHGVKNLYRYGDKFLISKDGVLELFKDIPFLNGGLFDCLDKENGSGKVIYIDGFSRNPAKQSIIPDYLFFQQEEERVDLSNYGLGDSRPVRGLIEILNSYNFTIDENTPVDQEIALDPELLGKVFENLLASYNPETATTARKATGSYYTPREIVDYMVEESLFEYLSSKLPSPPVGEGEGWRHSREGGNPEVKELDARLRTSGMTDNKEQILRQLLSYSEEMPEFSASESQKIISAIDDIKILDPACGSGAFPMGILHKLVYALQKLDPENKYWHELQYQKALKESEKVFKQDDKNERQERLKEINETFDEGINYPDYARKLYLIENCIYGVDIQPIAIQISKLRFFISLVLDQKVDRAKGNLGIRALPNLETKFIAANTLIGLDRPAQLTFKNLDIEKKEEELKQIRHRYFEAKTRKEKIDYQKKDQQIRKEIADLLEHCGWDTSTAGKIVKFDLYDQNASAEFFEPEWMFGITDGFDVVIGNPPWGAKLKAEEKELFKTTYPKIDSSTPNTFSYFIGWAFKNYKSVVSYVLPDSILIKDFAKTRAYIKDNISEIIWYENTGIPEEHRPFVYVDHDVCVMNIFKRKCETLKYSLCRFDRNQNQLTELKYIKDKSIIILEEFEFVFNLIAQDRDFKILKKISKFEKLDNFMQCHEGIHTGNSREILFLEKQKNKHCHPLYYGAGVGDIIQNYVSRTSGWFVDYRAELIDKSNGFYASLRDERIFKFPKIYITRTGNPFKAFYDENTYASNNFFSLQHIDYSKNEGQLLKFFLPFILSKPAQYFIRTFAAPRLGSTFIETKIFHLLKFRVPLISDKERKPIITLVDQILAAKQKDPDADTSALEKQIEQMVYKLYDLTSEEIAIVEGRK